MAKRRTTDQICADLRKERGGLYTKRTSSLKQLQKSSISKKDKAKYQKRYDKASKRLDYIKEYLFKCSKKFAKLKTQKTKVNQRKSYLGKKFKEATTNKEKNKLLKGIRDVVGDGNKLDVLMNRAVGMEKGEVQFKQSGIGIADQIIPAWLLVEEARTLMLSKRFDNIVIDGEPFPVDDKNLFPIIDRLDTMLVNIIKKQSKTQTPMVSIYFNVNDKVIVIDEMIN